MYRGSREYISPVTGSFTKQCRFSVVCFVNGSRYTVSGSGTRSMSDSWISWNPRIDEPSNPSPSSKLSSESWEIGIEKCCIRPGRSEKRRSTISAPVSFASARTSFGVAMRAFPLSHRWPRMGSRVGAAGAGVVTSALRLGYRMRNVAAASALEDLEGVAGGREAGLDRAVDVAAPYLGDVAPREDEAAPRRLQRTESVDELTRPEAAPRAVRPRIGGPVVAADLADLDAGEQRLELVEHDPAVAVDERGVRVREGHHQ